MLHWPVSGTKLQHTLALLDTKTECDIYVTTLYEKILNELFCNST